MKDQATSPWAEYVVEGAPDGGVSARELAALLENLTTAARHVAAGLLGQGPSVGRTGYPDRSLSDFRVKEVAEGCVQITLSPPSSEPGIQLQLLDGESKSVTSSDVVALLQNELADFDPEEREMNPARHAALADVIRASLRLGTEAWMSTTIGSRNQTRTIPLRRHRAGLAEKRSLISYGFVYMVDVEPGASKIRIRSFDHESIRMDVPASFRERLNEVIGKPVEVRYQETRRSSNRTTKLVTGIRMLSGAEYGRAPIPTRWLRIASDLGISLDSPPAEIDFDDTRFKNKEELEDFAAFVDAMRADVLA